MTTYEKIERLLKGRIEPIPESGCYLWLGGVTTAGYGAQTTGGTTRCVHRMAWEALNGGIPDGMCVCHKCDTPTCCNPSHMFIGTRADNMRDKVEKGRQRNRFLYGSESGAAVLHEDQVKTIRRLIDEGVPHREIALRFGVAKSTITAIATRRNWGHLS